ncbi:putative metalloreductase transmembrane component [Aspergillus clavatus NRRL 1]|uniref:ferric-chelate reductase (NADPH) n=1 Tax=Aspergillus clavatus (strain ATCC 1007 / CBS 513.65 / DSM 816 / NCTC 3887 / NRRL 1 / QM 1276 / 107) TaxID=344612 RepID=A1CMV0_ASPCL|nr:metalloreductase transmembrane component, putative [Aspergillus clavatus NRRL 1]EAW08887.1 metalloreductase transmembrane component, putative [Aspergillus clavatus NRRL 1]
MLLDWGSVASLVKRINIPTTASTTPDVVAERQRDPWSQSGKYGLGWVYFCIILLALAAVIRYYHVWGDKMRIALCKEDQADTSQTNSPQDEYELPSAATDSSDAQFFPARGPLPGFKKQQSSVSTIAPLNNAIAFMRWIFYRPIPSLKAGKLHIVFPSMGASAVVLVALIFVTLYCFVPQPLYYTSIAIGSPPLAIRAGMIAVAMVPWIVMLSTRANFISMLTGFGHERLNVLHRWAGYLCLFLSLIHTIPFFVTPIWEDGALIWYQQYLPRHVWVYGTGMAAFVPLIFLCVHSLPALRSWMYELFLLMHLPAAVVFVAMLLWHCKNFLASWDYLWATIAIWLSSYLARLFYLNWTNPFRISFLIGEESAVTMLPHNAIKVTVATRMRWKPGQYVYLRMPGISPLGRHPFTIASLCSDDFPSKYGEAYRDLTLVFRPFGGFTRKVYLKAFEHGPYKTWTAYLEGPYGGMRREMAAFDDVIFFAGGSGITAIASQLLSLIKKMREGKAVTKRVRVIWALRSPEAIEWFREELRICREHAPANTVHCHFFLTGPRHGSPPDSNQPGNGLVQEKIYNMLQGMDKRNSAYIRAAAAGDLDREKELRRENEDAITSLPRIYTSPVASSSRQFNTLGFAFPGTPSPPPQKSVPRFAALPLQRRDGWRIDRMRPDIPRMLADYAQTFGRRTCVFVCGPPSMRIEVTKTVARLQQLVMMDSSKDEIFLHAENYNI